MIFNIQINLSRMSFEINLKNYAAMYSKNEILFKTNLHCKFFLIRNLMISSTGNDKVSDLNLNPEL